jgi:hypothetical protein
MQRNGQMEVDFKVSLQFAERYHVTLQENPRYAEKRPGDDVHVPPLFRTAQASPAQSRKEKKKGGVLAFMSQDARERSFGVITRQRISIAMEPYPHKIEGLKGNLPSQRSRTSAGFSACS